MTVTSAQLVTYIGASATDDVARVGECLDEAIALVTVYVGGVSTGDPSLWTDLYSPGCPVPDVIADRAIKEVGKALFDRKDTSTGQTQFADGTPVSIAAPRDPLTTVYPMLKRFLGLGFA